VARREIGLAVALLVGGVALALAARYFRRV
jgi:hypothetical protein